VIIGILATGSAPEELLEQYGSYPDMFQRLLATAGMDFDYLTFDAWADEFPDSALACDAWLISGSKFNVNQQLPWMGRLKRLIRDISVSDRPMVGICFGHQIVAEAFGGRVGLNPGGWGVGSHQYDVSGARQAMLGKSLRLNAMHRYQVLEKPPAAETVASSTFCPHAALRYGDRILTLQAHPEFTVEFERALLTARRGRVVPEGAADAGLASLSEPGATADAILVGLWLGSFLVKGNEREPCCQGAGAAAAVRQAGSS